MVKLFANNGDPDQMLHSSASDLGLHCLPITLFGVSRLQWVKFRRAYIYSKATSKTCLSFSIVISHFWPINYLLVCIP